MQHIEDNTERNTENRTENTPDTPDTEYRYRTKDNNNMQHIEDNREQDNTEQRTENSTYDLYTYSFDLYHEYVSIKNSNTIELYTISK